MNIRSALPRRPAGFTMLELIAAVGILGILASLAAPSFQDMMADQRVKSVSFELTAALSLARGEARKQNGNVTIASKAGTEWANGWDVVGPDGETLATQGAHPGITVTGPASIVYNRTGRSSAAVTLQVTSLVNSSTVSPRCISVGVTGLPKSVKGSCAS